MDGEKYSIDYSALIHLQPEELRNEVLEVIAKSIRVCRSTNFLSPKCGHSSMLLGDMDSLHTLTGRLFHGASRLEIASRCILPLTPPVRRHHSC